MTDNRIIRKAELRKLTGLSDTTIYRLGKAGKFPSKVQLSTRAVGWKLSDVNSWINNCGNDTDTLQ